MCKQSDAVTLAARCERAVLRSTEERSQIHVREEAERGDSYMQMQSWCTMRISYMEGGVRMNLAATVELDRLLGEIRRMSESGKSTVDRREVVRVLGRIHDILWLITMG